VNFIRTHNHLARI
jgi:hypothetical protein